MTLRIIETEADLAEGAAFLCEVEPRFAELLALTGPLPLRRRPDGFAALLDMIVSQQVSTASAAAIHGRLAAAGFDRAELVAAATPEALAACGLSRPKIAYLRAIAAAAPHYGALRSLPDDDVAAALTALKGVGRWTADLYLLSALGRADVMPAGDLALQEAARHLFDRPGRPGVAELDALAAPWRPWRAVAARALWAYYRHIKGREGTR
ncbi:MAG: DNA-3-methyladenine glycosylase family protein [Albidovulum sp.]